MFLKLIIACPLRDDALPRKRIAYDTSLPNSMPFINTKSSKSALIISLSDIQMLPKSLHLVSYHFIPS